ncbi:histidinol-phosphatase [Parazoarcus communis]|uniref:Histidinol-phosphatase n=1 Tax=Parazoarcus communis TaxID=41977 RepID=A0A2U8GZ66_9RHOO|nr:histidinol-phosphatase [Parazoarcus communis]AWI78744.1 histidinol-phosphatase [Parazoarcus communis]
MPYTDNPESLLSTAVALAHRLADEARRIALPRFRTPLDVFVKDDESPVTVADREVEAALRTLIGETFPDHGILGEEQGRENMDAEYVWVIDPIDGTKSFITGSPLWGALIALLHRGRPVLGLIDIPYTGERWSAAGGAQTLFNGQQARTRGCAELGAACIYTTSPDAFEPADWARFDALSRRTALRRFGGDSYCYGLLASGHVDLVVEAGLQPYDYLALVPVIEGAGGVITDWQGRPLGVDSDGRVVAAATASLHAAALAGLGA